MEVGRRRPGPPRGEGARDSGILLHCVGPDGAAGGHWMESMECQIIEGGCGDFIMVGGRTQAEPDLRDRGSAPDKQLYYEKGGKPVTPRRRPVQLVGPRPGVEGRARASAASSDVEKPAGEWNRMEVICDGDTITNIVNGYVVNVGTKSSQTEGKILFQSEGAEIFFRKIEVRPLDKK